ncbi:sensor histidine kinase [Streptosporangium jomthongense]|uniref:Sensor histidine kinase n=1 Tax=Streptosporangium jomthongense TaxID=1193683 RepID=A0ABV8FBE5_9ACTN
MLIVVVVLVGAAFDPLHPVPSAPFALVVALQVLHCLTPWRSRWSLAVQALLLPWAGPAAAGMVAASALLILRGTARWCAFATVVVTAAVTAAVLAPATPFGITLAVLNAACQGLVLFGVTRLGDTRAALHAARAELAAGSVSDERSRAARELDSVLGTALSTIVSLAGHGEAAKIAEVSRATAARARAVPAPAAAAAPEPDLMPRLALPILVAVHAGYLVTALIYLGGRPVLSLLAAGILGLHLHHALPRPYGARPGHGVWTACLLLLLTAVTLLLPGQAHPQLAGFAVAGFLALGRAWWPVAGAVVAALAVVLAVRGQAPAENLYWTFDAVAVAAMFHGLAVQTSLVLQARRAQRALAALAAADERRRISRDVHDLLGYGLSAITVKAELAVRAGEENAREQLVEIAAIARRSLAALRDIPAEPDPRLSLAAEIDSACSVLRAAGVEVTVRRESDRDDALPAIVLREAVTNVLRHSEAGHCLIEITEDGLLVVNDGVHGPPGAGEGGSGTANLTARVTAAGGTLTAGYADGEYRLVVLYPAVLSGDADGVEPVARV